MEKIIDERYFDLIIDNTLVKKYDTGDNITPLNDTHAIMHVLSENTEPCELGNYRYHRFPAIYTLMSQTSLEASGIISVQNNPYLALYGNRILVGVVDTGIDYQHPAFLYRDGTSRILSIWDQTIQTGPVPSGFKYGTEYSRDLINLAIKNSNPLSIVPSVDDNGHGTAIASIMAGSRNDAELFRGVAPESELVVVKLKEAKQNIRQVSFVPEDAECYQETDIMLAIRYLVEMSISLRRPIAICLALGTSQGSHNGYGTLSEYIDSLVLIPGIDISVAAGNEGNSRRHYYSLVETAPFTRFFEMRVSEQDRLFAMEIWAKIPARLAIEITSPTGESTNFIYPQIQSCLDFNFIFEISRIWVNNISFEEETGDQLILLRFENAQEGVWRIQITNIEEEGFTFNAWLPAGNLLSSETYFLEPSPDTTITAPGNVPNPLTVTAYDPASDSIVIESGRGYTVNNQVKPDIAAPGFELTCAYPNDRYGSLTGTGAAAAHAAGTMAMLLEWAVVKGNYTSITGNDINKLIIRGANRQQPVYTYPNNIWGYGKLDIYNVFRKLSL